MFFRKARALERLATANEAQAHIQHGILECLGALVRMRAEESKQTAEGIAASREAQAKAWNLVEQFQPLISGLLTGSASRPPHVEVGPAQLPPAPPPRRIGNVVVDGAPLPITTTVPGE